MELKEAIKKLKNFQIFAVDDNVLDNAIDTVLQALEDFQEENEGLRKLSDHYQNLINYKYIQKDKIKEKIELIKTLRVAFYNEANVISILQELLKGE